MPLRVVLEKERPLVLGRRVAVLTWRPGFYNSYVTSTFITSNTAVLTWRLGEMLPGVEKREQQREAARDAGRRRRRGADSRVVERHRRPLHSDEAWEGVDGVLHRSPSIRAGRYVDHVR